MNRWIGLAAKLYPRAWRQRYGEEFDALVEDVNPSWRQFTDVTRGAMQMQIKTGASYLRVAGVVAVAGAIAAAAMSFRVPPRYVSSAVIQLQSEPRGEHPISKEAMNKHLNRDVELLEAFVVSRGSLSEMVARPALDLYQEERRSLPLETILQQMRERDLQISVRRMPGEGTPAITVSFAHPDREKAQAVVRGLVTRLIESTEAIYKQRENTSQLVWRQPTPMRERVQVLDPPSLPEKPEGPNRALWIAAGLGGGLLSGLLIASALRRPKWSLQMVACAAAGCALAYGISLKLPKTYRSSTVMRITPSLDPKNISGEAPAEDVPAWIARLQHKVLSRGSLAEMIQRPRLDLYKEQRSSQPLEEIVERMRNRDISIRTVNSPVGASSSFLIEFSYPDPEKAQAVVRELVSRFMEENIAVERERGKADPELERVNEYKAGQNLEVLDPPSQPFEPVAPNRLALSAAGLLTGLLLGAILLRHRMQGLQLPPEGGQQVQP